MQISVEILNYLHLKPSNKMKENKKKAAAAEAETTTADMSAAASETAEATTGESVAEVEEDAAPVTPPPARREKAFSQEEYDKAGKIAAVCHQANKAYCEAFTGDRTQKDWAYAGADIHSSAINGVMFRLANPDGTSEDQHAAWMKDKVADGWVYGPVKDAASKTHPCIMPYSELPEPQRRKDAIFIGIVDALK